MSKTGVWVTMGCCCVALAASAHGQTRQPGLWEVTTQMSMAGQQAPQMPQLPPGVQLPPGMQMPASPYAPHTMQVCVTQAMIDKYGGPAAQPPRGNCQMTNVVMKPNGMTANMTCTGALTATGTVNSTWTDVNSSKTTVHLTGTMQMGQNSQPVDMTMTSSSTFKGSDCGSVKPPPMPSGQ